MRINVAVPEAHVDAPVLDSALEAVTRLNESLLRKGVVPSFERALKHGIKWRPEPPGAEHFDHAGTVLRRKWGDCDDLAPWHAASLRHSGEDPKAEAVVHRSGPQRWHAVVRRGDGSIDDPSKRAGMGQPHGVHGAVLGLMDHAPGANVSGAYIVRPQIALRPVYGAWQARADIPWHWREHMRKNKPTPTDYAMTALHTAPVASAALVGALEGACELAACAGAGDDHHIDRLCAIADACEGATYDDLVHVYGHEDAQAATQIVGSFFGSLANLVAPVAKMVAPLASKALQFVPGVGPMASMAFDAAREHILPRILPGSPEQAAQLVTQALQPGAPGARASARSMRPPGGVPQSGRICFPATFE